VAENRLRNALFALWSDDHAKPQSLGPHGASTAFSNLWDLGGADRVHEALGESDIEHVTEVELGRERWVFACVGGNGRLIRFGADGELKVVFLGRLTGGRYVETVDESSVTATLHHPRLGDEPLCIVKASRSATAGLRQLLREWADFDERG
jgi:hypothetical protein